MRLAASRLLAARAGHRLRAAMLAPCPSSRSAGSLVAHRRSNPTPEQSRRHRRLKPFSTSPSTSTSTPSSAAEELASWIESRGGSAPGDRVSVFAEGASRGLALRCGPTGATAGEALVKLPSTCVLRGSGGPSSSLLPPEVEGAVDDLCSRVPDELWGAKLALRLLAHRAAGDSSPLAPYVRALPAGVPGAPIFYGPKAIEALSEYAPVGSQVVRRCRFLSSFVEREGLDSASPSSPASVAFSGARVDANALAWGLSVVSSRAFRVDGGENALPSCLPLIDMCNHDFSPTARVVPWRSGEGAGDGGGVALVATRDLGSREPLTLNYGALPSDFFLLDYGFFPPYPGNPFDVVKLRFSQALVDASAEFARVRMPGDGSLSEPWRAAALAPLDLGRDPEVHVLASFPWVDRRFVAAARVAAAASPVDLRGRSVGVGVGSAAPSSRPPLSDLDGGALSDPSAEARALRLLGGACLLSLSSFPTTAEHDRALLSLNKNEEGALTDADEVSARRFILSKKEVLERAAKELGARARVAAAKAKASSSSGGSARATKKGFGR